MLFLLLVLRCHFAGTPVVASQNVGCFLDHVTELQKWRFLCSQVLRLLVHYSSSCHFRNSGNTRQKVISRLCSRKKWGEPSTWNLWNTGYPACIIYEKDLLVIQEHKNGVNGYQAFLELSLQQIGEPNPVWLISLPVKMVTQWWIIHRIKKPLGVEGWSINWILILALDLFWVTHDSPKLYKDDCEVPKQRMKNTQNKMIKKNT